MVRPQVGQQKKKTIDDFCFFFRHRRRPDFHRQMQSNPQRSRIGLDGGVYGQILGVRDAESNCHQMFADARRLGVSGFF